MIRRRVFVVSTDPRCSPGSGCWASSSLLSLSVRVLVCGFLLAGYEYDSLRRAEYITFDIRRPRRQQQQQQQRQQRGQQPRRHQHQQRHDFFFYPGVRGRVLEVRGSVVSTYKYVQRCTPVAINRNEGHELWALRCTIQTILNRFNQVHFFTGYYFRVVENPFFRFFLWGDRSMGGRAGGRA